MGGRGSGGHNAKSASLHVAEGTYRRDRHGPLPGAAGVPVNRAPQRPPGDVPKAPAGLSASSKKLWVKFHEQYEMTSVATLKLLESALRSLDLADVAWQTMTEEGLTFMDGGKPRAHPAAAIHRDARAAFVATMKVLGFPSETS